jgi:hypothetical protein
VQFIRLLTFGSRPRFTAAERALTNGTHPARMAPESAQVTSFDAFLHSVSAWEHLLESDAQETAQKQLNVLRRSVPRQRTPNEPTPRDAAHALETLWLKKHAALWYRWTPTLCQGVRNGRAASCSLLCFLFDGAQRFLYPLCGMVLKAPRRATRMEGAPNATSTMKSARQQTFVPMSERYRLHLQLVYDTLVETMQAQLTQAATALTGIVSRGGVDSSTSTCQLMRCLGVVVQNTPSRCLPSAQLKTAGNLLWDQYALSLGPELETLRAAAISCLKSIHDRLQTIPPLEQLLANPLRWNDAHVVSFVEAMLTLRMRHLSRVQESAPDSTAVDELVLAMVEHHFRSASTSPALRLQSARLLRLLLRSRPSIASSRNALLFRMLKDPFHAVRVVAIACLSQPGIGAAGTPLFRELEALTADPIASMRAAACTALGRLAADPGAFIPQTEPTIILDNDWNALKGRAMDLLLKRLEEDPNVHVRAAAAYSLSQFCTHAERLAAQLPERIIELAIDELRRAPYSSQASAYCRLLGASVPSEAQRTQIVVVIGDIVQGARRKALRQQAILALAKHVRPADGAARWSLAQKPDNELDLDQCGRNAAPAETPHQDAVASNRTGA